MPVQLGFVEEMLPVTSFPPLDSFPSKIGGQPIWLHPAYPLSSKRAICSLCDNIMILLMQLYAPGETEASYHRVLYIFTCRNGECHQKDSKKCFKVFRCQLPEMNDYTNGNPLAKSVCHVCGLLGDKACGQCHQANYCSKEHQKIHWTVYNHREHCGTSNTIKSPTILFKELELVSEEEPNETTQLIQDSFQNLSVAPVSHFVENVKEIELEEDAEDSQVNVDKAFLKFQKKMLLEPEQVMRYDRHFNEPIQGPLWANDTVIPTMKDIPPCPHCQGHRSFEFQLTPQLLHYLNIVHASKDSIDFGTLIIYTCSNDCDIKANDYVEEILWKQDFSNDGLWKPQEK